MLKFLIFACLAAGISAAVYRYSEEKKPKEFENCVGCYLSVLGYVLPYDINQYPTLGSKCEVWYCNSVNNETTVSTCGVISIAESDKQRCSEVKGDLNKPYPECCNSIVCKEQN